MGGAGLLIFFCCLCLDHFIAALCSSYAGSSALVCPHAGHEAEGGDSEIGFTSAEKRCLTFHEMFRRQLACGCVSQACPCRTSCGEGLGLAGGWKRRSWLGSACPGPDSKRPQTASGPALQFRPCLPGEERNVSARYSRSSLVSSAGD